jgi:hypothetical protein
VLGGSGNQSVQLIAIDDPLALDDGLRRKGAPFGPAFKEALCFRDIVELDCIEGVVAPEDGEYRTLGFVGVGGEELARLIGKLAGLVGDRFFAEGHAEPLRDRAYRFARLDREEVELLATAFDVSDPPHALTVATTFP